MEEGSIGSYITDWTHTVRITPTINPPNTTTTNTDTNTLLQVACGDKAGNIRVYDLSRMELAHSQVRKADRRTERRVFRKLGVGVIPELSHSNLKAFR